MCPATTRCARDMTFEIDDDDEVGKGALIECLQGSRLKATGTWVSSLQQ